MSREDLIQVEGTIIEMSSGGHYKVRLTNDQVINAKLSGRMRKFYIKVIVGDWVTVGISPYDPSHGLIQYRHKNGKRETPPSDTSS